MEKSLKARAVDLLSRREYSRRELERRLAPHAESAEALAAVLDELAERNWQSDARFAEQFAEARARKYGTRRVRMEMRERGVDAGLIDEALSGHDDFPAALAQWQKKFGQLPQSPEEKARQIRFLATRGFGMDVIRRILRHAADDLPDDPSL